MRRSTQIAQARKCVVDTCASLGPRVSAAVLAALCDGSYPPSAVSEFHHPRAYFCVTFRGHGLWHSLLWVEQMIYDSSRISHGSIWQFLGALLRWKLRERRCSADDVMRHSACGV